ncbi:MAG: DUF4249 domain-containing protein [Phaeodactylibacter sp.]|nr:DUF4249 domain-containing protein [Phaeodactylibacter sp.]MCB9293305.1 DUF4249 domain-containing protein [Lewinellaceae bacterium]
MYQLHRSLLLAVLAIVALWACDLEQEVDIDLPEYESRIILECYLEPGQPFSLLLSRSQPFFDPFPALNQDFLSNILIDSARIEIAHNGRTYVLENRLAFNPQTRKVFNYYSSEKVPFDTIAPFELSVTLPDGRTISGTTRILPAVEIDSLVVQFAESDTLARVLTYFTDDTSERNYYRRMFHQSSLDSSAVQDFSVDDRILEGTAVFGTGYNYSEGDTVISTLFHIDRSYYEFLESVGDALGSNGNPFAQPSPIISNLEGTVDAVGIFTGISYDRKAIILEK